MCRVRVPTAPHSHSGSKPLRHWQDLAVLPVAACSRHCAATAAASGRLAAPGPVTGWARAGHVGPGPGARPPHRVRLAPAVARPQGDMGVVTPARPGPRGAPAVQPGGALGGAGNHCSGREPLAPVAWLEPSSRHWPRRRQCHGEPGPASEPRSDAPAAGPAAAAGVASWVTVYHHDSEHGGGEAPGGPDSGSLPQCQRFAIQVGRGGPARLTSRRGRPGRPARPAISKPGPGTT